MKTKIKIPAAKKAKRYFAKKLAFTTGPMELSHWIKERANVQVIDVRGTDDYAKGHIPGAINWPKENWAKPVKSERGQVNVVYCYSQVCHLAARAAFELADKGLPAMELEGGFDTWKTYGLPIQKSAAKKKASAGHTHHRKHGTSAMAKAETEFVPETETQAVVGTTDAANPR